MGSPIPQPRRATVGLQVRGIKEAGAGCEVHVDRSGVADVHSPKTIYNSGIRHMSLYKWSI